MAAAAGRLGRAPVTLLMTSRPELTSLREAFVALSVDAERVVLADQPGRRCVVRIGDLVVKAVAPSEHAAWRREESGLRAMIGAGMAAPLVASGPLWTATGWVEGVSPAHCALDMVNLHRSLGEHLARLHEVGPTGMGPWPVADRLAALLEAPPACCPPSLVRGIARMVGPWMRLPAAAMQRYVHGDWGTSNVLVHPRDTTIMLTVVDFEDSHIGDPAEDFRWQVLAGPQSVEHSAMRIGYGNAGRTLGPDASERLALSGAELCLDMLRWDAPGDRVVAFHNRCLQTLDELVSGQLPEAP